MLAIIFDIFFAYLIAKNFEKLWAQIPLAALGGVISTIVAIIAASVVAGSRNVDAVGAIVVGVFFNPLVTLISLWFFRRKLRKTLEQQSQTKEE